jgi:putative Ca2+/H+ antiporter (TMEM165/GDT1 family)
MQALMVSAGAVTLAEVGDKTQLLAFILAARFKKPVPILLGILMATLINHGLAGAFGAWITTLIDPQWLRWILGGSFLAMAVWILIPDSIDEEETLSLKTMGVFTTTLVTFFLAEMGDKTQIATIALAAHYPSTVEVVAGTTLGMMLADGPAVFVGQHLAQKIPMKLMHAIAGAIFALLGVAVLANLDTLIEQWLS